MNRYQFEVLSSYALHDDLTQRDIAQAAGIALGSVNKAIKEMKQSGCLSDACEITDKGLAALDPYRVKRAIILAAGFGGRIAPLSYEMPKALLRVRGDVLIERLIGQLREAGVADITVVVGHMKEAFFYLGPKYGVDIRINPEFANRNNHASLLAAKDKVRDCYICSADQYFTANPFATYFYDATMNALMVEGETRRRCVRTDDNDIITGVCMGGCDEPGLIGCAYLNSEFGERLVKIIESEYDLPATAQKRWDDIWWDHLDEVPLKLRVLPAGSMFEFDRISELTKFDADFMDNVDLSIFDNICSLVQCERSDIRDVVPLKEGLTNLSFRFTCKGQTYVYRYPGAGTEEIINRAAEAHALGVAKELGLDETFIYEDPESGWKMSRFIEGCEPFDYRNDKHVNKALQLGYRLHTSGATSPWSFDFYDEAVRIVDILKRMRYPLAGDFDELSSMISGIACSLKDMAGEPVLCHNDFFGPNFLVRGEGMWLIDWEYAAMGDWACDIGNFIAQGSGYSVSEAVAMLDMYFGRKPTQEEIVHCVSATAVVGYYWYVWAIYKEAKGNPVGQWLYTWYKAANDFGAAAERLLNEESREDS